MSQPAAVTPVPPASPEPKPALTLTSRVLTSLAWIFTNIFARNGIQFVRMWVLWKLLSPRDFGLNSMAWIAISGVVLLQDMGFASALIQRKKDLEAAISVTWYANIVIRGLMFLVLYLIAPAMSENMGEPELTSILRWASFSVVLGAAGTANETLLRKNFQFRKVLVVDLAEAVVLTVVQIVTAWMGHGVWSLVYGTLASVAVRSLVLWRIAPIKVGRFDVRVAKEMFHFGKHMTLSTLGLWLIKNMDYYLVGKFLGAAALGLYTLAFKLSDMIAVNVVRQLGSVLFPAFSEIGNDHQRAKAAWGKAVRYSLALVMPMGVGLIVFSEEIVLSFFKKGGMEVALPVSILTVFALCRSVGSPLGDLAKGIGKPQILTQVVLWHVLLMAPLLYFITAHLGLDQRAGLVAVSCAVSGCAIFAISLSFYLTSRVVRFKAMEVVAALLPAVVAGTAMALVGWGVRFGVSAAFGPRGLKPLLVLVLGGGLSGLVYVVVLALAFPSIFKGLKDSLRRRRERKRA